MLWTISQICQKSVDKTNKLSIHVREYWSSLSLNQKSGKTASSFDVFRPPSSKRDTAMLPSFSGQQKYVLWLLLFSHQFCWLINAGLWRNLWRTLFPRCSLSARKFSVADAPNIFVPRFLCSFVVLLWAPFEKASLRKLHRSQCEERQC